MLLGTGGGAGGATGVGVVAGTGGGSTCFGGIGGAMTVGDGGIGGDCTRCAAGCLLWLYAVCLGSFFGGELLVIE